MILVIDNYDSFVHNLARYLRQICDQEIHVVRNDEIDCEQVNQLAPSAIVISPGPCRPIDSGNTLQIVQGCHLTPMLGICLGHQAIVEAFGGKVIRSAKPTHGKPDQVFHVGDHSLFDEIPTEFTAGRYHSLIANSHSIPSSIEVIASLADETVMAIAHREYPVFGVQFHPESVLTQHGYRLLHNFLKIASVNSWLPESEVAN